MGVVILSTLVFILSTMPELTDDIDLISNTTYNVKEGVKPMERWEDVIELVYVAISSFNISF